MPSFTATASGKIILFGEHAVVYGEPAIAVPVQSFQARVVVNPEIGSPTGKILIDAPDISLKSEIIDIPEDHPLRVAIKEAAGDLEITSLPACRILISSTIPQASGLGSSAAISTALIRALSAFLGRRMTEEEVSRAAFEVEKIHHGTPSGIDNSVVVYQQPVYYQKGSSMEFLTIQSPFSILIIASGTPGDTRQAVADVQERWQNEPVRFNQIFTEIGEITRQARKLILQGNHEELGPLMDQNHVCLQDLGVSTPGLDHLAQIARDAGALGAKLSGGGLGGHLIALVHDQADAIREHLLAEGAESVTQTLVGTTPIPLK
jgi:mevalonate kinase